MASSPSSRQKCHQISLDEITDATDNFSDTNVLGQGGEGKVYLAEIILDQKRTLVAVKHLKPNSKEFENEIKIVSKIQHPNLVSLLGYCDESGQKILLYEFMQKGSLASYLKKKSSISLSWQQRLRICLDAARGLQHLHAKTNEFPKGIIHRDVKPDNILLDKNWVAKISDFGMFKLSHVDQVQSTMITNLKGTGGYYAPEYIIYHSITRKIDVYAFGVVLFQVLCLKMPWDRGEESYNYYTDDEDLEFWAQQNVESRIKEEISDDSLKVFTAIVGKSLKRDPTKRPTMDEVVLDLEIALKCQKREDEAKQLQAAVKEFDEQSIGFRPKAPSRINETIADDEYSDAIVIDIGGGFTKAGFARESYPPVVFQSLVGYYENSDSGNSAMGSNRRMRIGKDIFLTDDTISLTYPIYNGMVNNWEEYEEIIHHTLYNQLNYGPEDRHPVLLTEPTLSYDDVESTRKEHKSSREKLISLMFDKFDVPAVYIGIQPVLSLLSVGRSTGMVVESGEDVTYSVPIFEGYLLPHATTDLNVAGRRLTYDLKKIIEEKERVSIPSYEDLRFVRDMKEKLCYIALNYKAAETTIEEKSFTLPDGKVITLGKEFFQLPEALFDPSLAGFDRPGIQHNTYRSITMCDEEIRDKLYGSIVLGGGTTMLSGFGERLEKEMRELAPQSSSKIKIVAEPRREYSAWIGGAVLASLGNFKKMWISKAEYEEYGKNVVHTKCF